MSDNGLVLLDSNNQIESTWDDYITHVNLITVPAPIPHAPGATGCTSTHFFHSTWSTAKVQEAFGFAAPAGDKKTMILGLDSVPSQQNPMTTVLSAFNIPDTFTFPEPLGSIVNTFKAKNAGAFPTFTIEEGQLMKNGMWILPASATSLQVYTALTFKFNFTSTINFLGEIANNLKSEFGLDVNLHDLKISSADDDKLPRITLKGTTTVAKADDGSFSTDSSHEITIQLPVKGFLVNLRFALGGEIELAVLDNPHVSGDIFQKISGLITNGPDNTSGDPRETGQLTGLRLWKISLKAKPAGANHKWSWKVALTISLTILSQTVSIGLIYDSELGTFTGGFLFKDMFQNRLLPNYDDLADLPLPVMNTLSDGFDFGTCTEFQSVRGVVPTVVTEALIVYQKASSGSSGSQSVLSLSAALESASAIGLGGNGPVPFPFTWKSISLDIVRKGNGDTTMDLFTSFQLTPRDARFQSSMLSVDFAYDSSLRLWSLTGHAESLSLGAIVSFFDPDMSGEVADILGGLTISTMTLSYTYELKAASSFLFVGQLVFGELKLTLYYQYAKAAARGNTAADKAKAGGQHPNLTPLTVPGDKDSSWQLDAYLDTADPGPTLGDIADSILGDDEGAKMPDFVRSIPVHTTTPQAHLVTVHASRVGNQATFLLNVALDVDGIDIEFTIAQITTKGATSKRLIRVSVGPLPFLSTLPVVKELPQPYQELEYVYVTDPGMTRDEVAAVNTQMDALGQDHKLYFKPATQNEAKTEIDPTTDSVVFVPGHHFIVVQDNAAVLDHVFHTEATPSPAPQPLIAPSHPSAAVSSLAVVRSSSSPDSSNDTEDPPTKGTMKKNTQFLSISAISLQYKSGTLWIYLDATLSLQALEFSLIGFGIGFDVTGLSLHDLSSLASPGKIQFQLKGMELAFSNPPVIIAGCFEHDKVTINNETLDSYRGGVAVSVEPYSFVAVGEYTEVKIANGGSYKSVFVYAKLDGPLIDLEFIELRGIRLGFGYNSSIRSPAVQELYQFPFIDDAVTSGAGNHPMAILEAIRGGDKPWVTVKEDSYWLAFGFTISSFDIINATAVAVVSFGSSGPVFSIYGDVLIAFPPDDPVPKAHVVYVEILMEAELNFVEDCFKVQAALAPTSFIYVPMAHLHGGFALYKFFGSNPHAGDWVLTIGGYDRRFDIPSHYPLPDRIGVDFSIGIIRISGNGYFALTPNTVMVGASLHCELDIGPVFAWLDASFDAMVQFHPMHYWIDCHIEVGVECDIPILFATIHIRVYVGAQLSIEGPEFGGSAYVDFWFFSFSIPFGAPPAEPNPIDLLPFFQVCQKAGPADASGNERTQTSNDLIVQLKFSLEDGVFPMPSDDTNKNGETDANKTPDDEGAGVKWYVKGGSFKFRVSSVFALTDAYFQTSTSGADQKVLLRNQKKQDMLQLQGGSADKRVSSIPMGCFNSIQSMLYIGVREVIDSAVVPDGWNPSFITKAMPKAVWGNARPTDADRLSSANPTQDMLMAVTVEAPPPLLAYAKIPQFRASDMAKACAGTNQLPVAEPEQTIFTPTDQSNTPQTWSDMKTLWDTSSNTNLELARAIATECTTALGWNNPSPDVKTQAQMSQTTPWVLEANFPLRLVRGTGGQDPDIRDGLENFYLELPLVSI